MTTTLDPTPVLKDPPGDYPILLRMGHRFKTSVGQRLVVDGLYGALDMAIDDEGWMYVLNKHVTANFGRVRFTVVSMDDTYRPDIRPAPDGKPEVHGQEILPSPVCCTIDSDGTLYHTDETANKVVTHSRSGETLGYWGESGDGPGQLNAPSGLAFDNDGNLWVVSTRSPRIQKFTPDGEFISGFGQFGTGPGQLNYPWGIAVDPINNSLLVADWRNDRIQRFSQDGEFMQIIGEPGDGVGQLNHPSDVAVDAHGDVYVCDRGNHRVLQFNPRGLFIESFVGDAPMTERGADKLMANMDMLRWRDHIYDLDREKWFYNPTSVVVDDQFRLYVVDSGRYRVQIYRKTFRELAPDQVDGAETYNDPKLN